LSDAPAAPADPAGGRRLRLSLRSSVDAVATSDGELVLVRAGEPDLRVRDAEPLDHALLRLLADGSWTGAELAAATGAAGDAVASKLRSLAAAGLLREEGERILDSGDRERFDRQLPFLAERGDAEALQQRLRRAHVAVLGCGGLGTWTVAGLAAAGVGRFTLVDDDRVETSNLNRQILFSPAQVGRAKVDEVARWLAAYDPRIAVTALPVRADGPAAVDAVLGDAELVVLAADWPPYEIARWVNAACLRRDRPFIVGGQAPPLIKLGPLYWPGRTACFACHETALRRESPHYDDYVAHLREAPARSATLGPAAGIVGAGIAMEALQLLTGAEPATLGAAILTDLRTMTARRVPVARDAACAACHDARGAAV
jgi:bacteriocin biosynthesis cyclodehydratase domain-containing protein